MECLTAARNQADETGGECRMPEKTFFSFFGRWTPEQSLRPVLTSLENVL
jgi:hypothetical protein